MSDNQSAHINRPVLIDVDDIIAARGVKLPRFAVRMIKRFIHQDFLNAYFEKGDVGLDFAWGALKYLDVKVEVRGEENIPSEGLFTFAANHPLGGIDALSAVAVIGTRYEGKIRYVANGFLSNLTQLAEYMSSPIDKTSSHQALQMARDIDEMFSSSNQMLWFPAGACSRKIDGVIQDYEWQKTFITKSRDTGRSVIPVWISGRNSWRFYFVDRLDRIFKTKFAMYCLPDELYRGQHQTITLIFGKPIPAETFTRERKDKDWAQMVRSEVYKLKPDDYEKDHRRR